MDIAQPTREALLRRGNKPFCDGTHAKIGLRSAN